MMEFVATEIDSPIGPILIVADGGRLRALDYSGYERRMHALLGAHYGPYRLRHDSRPDHVATALQAYFTGELGAIDRIEVGLGGTSFQRQAWSILRSIPAGATTTYGALAKRLGAPNAARAVGYANSLNPIAIVLPCHRVVGANGKLTGYAGGLERKRWLIEHERRHAPDPALS